MSLSELSHEPLKRGPITYIFNGRGARAWLPEITAERGWVYLIELRRLCALCMIEVNALNEGQVPVLWEETPPRPDERCDRCQLSFGERPRA